MLRIGQLMTRFPITVSPWMAVEEARKVAAQCGVHHLVVATPERVLGVLSRSDIERAPEHMLVAECMSSPAFTAPPLLGKDDAVAVMVEHHIGSLVVMRKGRPIGIVTRADLRSR